MSTNNKDLARDSNYNKAGVGWTAYLVALPAFVFLFIFKIIPFFNSLVLPLREFDAGDGIKAVAWAGMKNFKSLFGTGWFPKALGNTILFKLEFILLSCLTAFVLTLVLGFIRAKFWQRFFSAIFLLPYFIPAAVFGYFTLYAIENAGLFFLFSAQSMADPGIFRLVYPILEVIRNLGIPVIMILGAINSKRESDDGTGGFLHIQLIPALKALGLFALVQLSALLTLDYEIFSYLAAPGLHEGIGTIDAFIFRAGYETMDFGAASAAWLIRFIIQLGLSVLAFSLIKKHMAPSFFGTGIKVEKTKKRWGTLAGVVAGLFLLEIYLLFTTAPLAISVIETFQGSAPAAGSLISGLPLSRAFAVYLPAIAFAVIINAVFTILLAYPLTVKRLSGRRLYTMALIVVMNLGIGGVHEYLFFKGRGMLNTIWPYLIMGFFSLINVFVLKEIYNTKYTSIEDRTVNGIEGDAGSFARRFLPKVLKPVFGLSLLQFALMWNSVYPGLLIYQANPDKFSPALMFNNITESMQGHGITLEVLKLAAIVSIPGIIILLLLMIFSGHEVFIGQARE
ncbi:MAG: hypothetical protein GX352_03300 [Clostridiales bacterium]|nr:hypothetical protein [Clostridiales bacterium]